MCAHKWRGTCAYCGRQRNLTDDHVPPRSWLGQPSPSNLITVPACYECNRGFQKNDDYTRTVVALDLRAQQNAAAVSHLPEIFRSLVRPEAAGFRARLVQQMSSSQVLDHMGRPLGSRVSVERERIDATGERLMRGLHFHEGRQPLSKGSKVYVFSKPGYHDIDFIVPAFTKVFEQCAAQRVREIGPGFSYVAGASGEVFVWLMLLYGYFWWVVAVVPSHVQLPSADLPPSLQQ